MLLKTFVRIFVFENRFYDLKEEKIDTVQFLSITLVRFKKCMQFLLSIVPISARIQFWILFLQHLVLPCNTTIIAFFWINDFIEYACQYFQPIIMGNGLCFSHNLIPLSQLFTPEYMNVWEYYTITYEYTSNMYLPK